MNKKNVIHIFDEMTNEIDGQIRHLQVVSGKGVNALVMNELNSIVINLASVGYNLTKLKEELIEQLETSQVRVKKLEENKNFELKQRIKELETFVEGLKCNLKDENLTYVIQYVPNSNAMVDLSQPSMLKKYTLCYKGKPLEEWEEENQNLKEQIQNLKEQIKELQYQIEHNKRIRDFGNKQMVKKIKENKLLKQKLEIALNSLNYIAILDNNYIVAKLDAQQAIQKINDTKPENNTKQCKNCKHYYTDYDCLNDFCDVNKKEISLNDVCDKWEE